jgi:hypothetical protein
VTKTGPSRSVRWFWPIPTGKYWLDYGVLIDDPKLGQRDGSQLKVSIGYRLTTAVRGNVLENSEERALPPLTTRLRA